MRHLGAFGRRRPVQLGVFVEAPAICIGILLYWALLGGDRMQDYGWLRAGALEIVHGRPLYGPPDPQSLVLNNQFVYPPLVAYGLVPVAVLPRMLSYVVFLVLALGAFALALRLLGVRDRRCYAVAILSPAAFFAFSIGTLGPFLLLGAAAAWHWRDRPFRAGAVVGVTVVAKLFLWPLLVWLVATRRFGAAAAATLTAAAVAVVPWAGIGFGGMSEYPQLLRVLDNVQVPKSYSLAGLAWDLGFSNRVGTAALAVVAFAGCAAVFKAGRKPSGEVSAFALAIVSAVAATPLLWIHYLILLYIPLALAYRRLSWVWAAPLVLWIVPGPGATPGRTWETLLLPLASLVLGLLLWSRSREALVEGDALRLRPAKAGNSG
jgi:hypothetical protein